MARSILALVDHLGVLDVGIETLPERPLGFDVDVRRTVHRRIQQFGRKANGRSADEGRFAQQVEAIVFD